VTETRRKTRHFVYGLIIALVVGLAVNSRAEEGASTESASAQPTEADLEELVAPIALYPDSLVAQILAGSQYPTQIVEADRFVQQNSAMSASQLSAAAASQDWNPSVVALTNFPSVLHNMDQNLSWSSALGEAYYNDPSGVMNAVQVMRDRAYQAGTLKTTPQQTVTVTNGTTTTVTSSGNQTIVIQPANPQVVYVPTYNPTTVYGAPAEVYPGYSSTDLLAASLLSFGAGIAVGSLISNAWGCNWGGGNIVYNNNVWYGHNNIWGPNRWGPYNPYHPYNPYNPYHPYHPYGPYNPYHPNGPYNPYNPYHPYNAANHPYNQGYHPYNSGYHPNNPAYHPNNPAYHPYSGSTGYHPTTHNWNNGLNSWRGFDQHSTGFENRSAFNGFGHAGDTWAASNRGFNSLAGRGGGHSFSGFSGFHGGGGGFHGGGGHR
jgi:uncharacterized membrane protein YgcG